MKYIYRFFNYLPYPDALRLMEEKITEVVQQKICYIFFLQHEKVYTAGLKTSPDHIIGNIDVIRARRGGSVTVHNPGQLILYAVFPLSVIDSDLEKYIRTLEKSIMSLLHYYKIDSFQDDLHTGIWTASGKIGFIGIGAKKGAVYHGAALNVCNNLEDYEPIISCGLDLPVTSMENESGIHQWDLEEVSKQWYEYFQENMTNSFMR